MNAFEEIISLFFEEQNYWVRQSVKIDITKENKKEIGLPSMPRPELDMVALNVKENKLLLIEVKSFLDSPGVRYSGVSGENQKEAKRYRLFTDSKYRNIVTRKLREDYLEKGLVNEDTRINYALAAGKIHLNDEQKIESYFSKKGWIFVSPKTIKDKITTLSEKG